MRAVIYAGPGRVVLAEVRAPALLHPTDAVVRVMVAGICGTDLHVVRGDFPGVTHGTVLGHEFVGEVVEVGSATRRIRVGSIVMTSDFAACGICGMCERGPHWHGNERAFFGTGTGTSFGPALGGAQAEFVRVPLADTTLAELPAGCSVEAALLIGDTLATGVLPGDCVAVVGGGAVGQLAALAAHAIGAGIVVVEPAAPRREFARAQGSLAAHPNEVLTLVRQVTGGGGADVVVEAVGGNGPLDLALQLAGAAGRVVSVGAHSAEAWSFPVARAFRSELRVGVAIGDSIRMRQRLASSTTAATRWTTPARTRSARS